MIRGVRNGQHGVLTTLLLEARALRQRPVLGLATTLALVLFGLLANLPLDTYGPEAPSSHSGLRLSSGRSSAELRAERSPRPSGVLAWYLDLQPEGSFGPSLPIALALFAYTLVAAFIVPFVHIVDIQWDRLAQDRELYEELFRTSAPRGEQPADIVFAPESQEKDAEPSARAALRQARLRLSTVANLN